MNKNAINKNINIYKNNNNNTKKRIKGKKTRKERKKEMWMESYQKVQDGGKLPKLAGKGNYRSSI